jgi:PAS domain S-box-containing protein
LTAFRHAGAKKIAHAAVDKNEALDNQFRAIIDTIPTLAWSALPNGALEFINQRWLDYTGLSLDGALGWGWTAAIHPDDRAAMEQDWRHAIETGAAFRHEARLRQHDGSYRWFLNHAVPLRDPSGTIVKWYGTTTDVEERKQAELALRRSEAYLAEAQRLSSTGSFGWKVSSGEIFWSEQTYRIFEWDRAVALTVERILERVHPDDLASVKEALDRASREKRDFDLIHRLVMPGGSTKYIHVIAHAVTDDAGELEFVGGLMDITAAKATEEALRENEQRFRDFSEAASDWHWESDAEHRFTTIGEGGATLARLHLDSDAVIGKTRWEIASDVADEPEKWREHIATLAAHQPFRRFIYRITPPNASPIYISANGKPRFDAQGAFLGYRGVNTEVTAAVRAAHAEDALQQVQAELAHVTRVTTLGELTASIAHEVNQPLAAIVTNGEASLRWLAREVPQIEEARRSLERMIADARRAGEVIRRIRGLAKKGDPEKAELDINDVIDEVIPLVQREAFRQGVTMRLELASALPPILGDRIQLQQVIMNLVINGIEAMAGVAGGQRDLVIRSHLYESGQVLVAVEDSGPGIQPENMDRLFEAFFTTKAKGMGMGLSISHSIVTAHGGRIWASRNAERGTTFQFTLPHQ